MSFLKYHNYSGSNVNINSSTKSLGNVMQVGTTKSSGLITVLSESGKLKWSKAFQAPGGIGYTTFVKVMPFEDGNFAVVGITNSIDSSSYKHPVVMKITGEGKVIWCNVFPSIQTDETRIYSEIHSGLSVYLTFYTVSTKTSGTLLLDENGEVKSRTKIINNSTSGQLWK